MQSTYHTCLLIDDNPLDSLITSKMLKTNNFADEIVISEQPEAALTLLKEGKVRPDVIFLDINMPKMNGFEFLNEYENIEIDKSRTKIFMLSSSIDPVDIKRAESNKYVEKYITKSLTPGILLQLAG